MARMTEPRIVARVDLRPCERGKGEDVDVVVHNGLDRVVSAVDVTKNHSA
jgi:hypothetical protein